MSGGWPRCGRSSMAGCPPRPPRWWRSGAGRWAGLCRCCGPPGTTRPVAIRRRRRARGTTGWRSSSTGLPGAVGVVVASASLHHVADVGEVLSRAGAALTSGGTLVVVEWAWERFDTATARWCFDRLPAPEADHNWLRNRHDEWQDSGLSWGGYCPAWAAQEGLHSGQEIVRQLGRPF